MQLVLNLSMLSPRPTGLGVYSEHCASALARRFNLGLIAGGSSLPAGEVLYQAPASVAIGGGKLAAIRRQLRMRSITLRPDQLLYSPTHHGASGVRGQIITIHDLICLRHPLQHKPQYLFFKYGLPLLLKKCRAVFAVSETTRQDVAATYGYPQEQIFVVPNGVDTGAFSVVEKSAAAINDPYLLMVGARYPHKNVDEVVRMARCWSARYRLIVTSCSPQYKESLLSLLDSSGVHARVEFLDYVERDTLLQLYQNASALVYPSRWEGFGIPPLEALACGVPVIASDIAVHREVLGKSAFFVQLGNASSWEQAFRDLENPLELGTKMAAARQTLQRFTWENSANILTQTLLQIEPGLSSSLRV